LDIERDFRASVLAILGDDFSTGLASDVATASTSSAAAVVEDAVVARGFLDLLPSWIGVGSAELSIPGSTNASSCTASVGTRIVAMSRGSHDYFNFF